MIIINRTQWNVNVIRFPGHMFNSPGSVPALNITVDHELKFTFQPQMDNTERLYKCTVHCVKAITTPSKVEVVVDV